MGRKRERWPRSLPCSKKNEGIYVAMQNLLANTWGGARGGGGKANGSAFSMEKTLIALYSYLHSIRSESEGGDENTGEGSAPLWRGKKKTAEHKKTGKKERRGLKTVRRYDHASCCATTGLTKQREPCQVINRRGRIEIVLEAARTAKKMYGIEASKEREKKRGESSRRGKGRKPKNIEMVRLRACEIFIRHERGS